MVYHGLPINSMVIFHGELLNKFPDGINHSQSCVVYDIVLPTWMGFELVQYQIL